MQGDRLSDWKATASTQKWKSPLQVVKKTEAPLSASQSEKFSTACSRTNSVVQPENIIGELSLISPRPNLASDDKMLGSSIHESSDLYGRPDYDNMEVFPDQIQDIVLYRKGGGSWDMSSPKKMKPLSSKMGHLGQRYLAKDGISVYIHMAVCDNLYDIPNTYMQAMKTPESEQWAQACKLELKSFKELHVFKEVPKTSSLKQHVVTGRWVFTVKKEIAGQRFKARLVAHGFKQRPGEDYFNTYAPVSKLDSFRLVLALAAINDWKICQLDAKNAFLNGKLDCTVYFQPPTTDIRPGYTWMLKRSVYGLNQASWLWYETLAKLLLRNGFKKSPNEECIFLSIML